MVHAKLRVLHVLLGAFACVPLARAQEPAAPAARHTRAALVSELDAVQPGRPLNLGIRLQMDPGWHTYWRNPGDAGLPTRVKWALPAGFTAGEIRWPYPARFASGPVVSYGYEREVLLAVPITVPASVSGHEVRISARVDWLECMEACLPGKAELSLALPVRRQARPGSDAPAFAESRRRVPVKDPRWRFTARQVGNAIALGILGPPGARVADASFFPASPRVLDHAQPQRLERLAGEHRLTLARDPNGAGLDRLTGVAVLNAAGGAPIAIEVDVPVQAAAAR